MNAKPPLLLTNAVAVKYANDRRGKHGVENPGYVVGDLTRSRAGYTRPTGHGSRLNRPIGCGTG
jgi:hypothetical protein